MRSNYASSSAAYISQIAELNEHITKLNQELDEAKTALAESEAKTALAESQKQNGIDEETIKNLNAQIDQLTLEQIQSANVRSLSASPAKKSVKLTWKSPKGISDLKYQIRYQKKGSGKWVTKTTSKKSLVIKKLSKGKSYRFKVRGYKKVSGKTVYTDYETTSWVKVK